MMMYNLNVCAKEALWTANLSEVNVCLVCRTITAYCDCLQLKLETTMVTVRHPAVKLCVFAALAILSDAKGDAHTLRFHTMSPDWHMTTALDMMSKVLESTSDPMSGNSSSVVRMFIIEDDNKTVSTYVDLPNCVLTTAPELPPAICTRRPS